MRAAVIHISNPFRPDLNRRVSPLTRRRRIRALAPQTRQPTIALLNGRPVLRAEWGRKLADGDVLMFVALPQGGGGGGSNPMRIILMLVVAWAAPYAAGWINGAAGLGLGTAGMTALTAGVGLVGNMLINTLIPAPRSPSPQQAAALAAPSPTYNLNAQGNLARLDGAIPVIYGRHVIYPDFAAQPYTEYAGNEQYLFELLCIGQGYYDIETLRIEDTVIESSVVSDNAVHAAVGAYADIDYQVVAPGEAVTLFPTNVVNVTEVAGSEMPGRATGTYSRSTTTVTVTQTAHGRAVGSWVYFDATAGTAPDGAFQIATVPTADTFTFTHTASGTDSAQACNIDTFLGPFVASAAGSTSNYLAFDFILPRGLYYYETDGSLSTRNVTAEMWARAIDDSGTPTGAWTNISGLGLDFTAATTTPQRQSVKHGVGTARYEVMVRRTDVKDTSTSAGHELLWGSARAYLPGSQNYGNVTMLALRMRASNSLSQAASRKINAIVNRKLPIWNGTTWSAPTVTRSIAWALADIARAAYGGKRADARIDLAGLLALDAIWTARGDRFDGIFDSTMTVWEAQQQVAKAGRAIPVEQGGVLRYVRDGAQTLPVAMFTTRNIVRGSLKIDYTMPSDETADAIDVEYFDSGVWQPRTVRAALPGSAEANVAKLKLFGVTGRDHAWREGMYMAAANRYRRRHVSFSTEMDGFIPTLGDLIALQHDVPSWGQAGEVTAYDGVTAVTTSEPLDWSAGGAHVIAFRKRDGSVDGPYVATAGATANDVVIASPSAAIYTGGAAERTHYAFGPTDAQYIEARMVSARPRSDSQADLVAVIESDFVHTAETGAIPGASAWQLPTRITKPVLSGLLARSSPEAADFMFLSWQASPGADHYLIEVSDSGNGWTRLGDTRGTTFTGVAAYGARTHLRVAPVGAVKGEWVEIAYGSSASYMWDPVDTTLMWSVDDTTKMWRY